MKRLRTTVLSIALASAAWVAPALAASDPSGLDALRTYNLIVLGTLTSNSEVEGRTFVGGDLTGSSSNYEISASVPASSYTVPGLTVVGNVTGGTKNLDNGSGAIVGGNVSSGFNLNGASQMVEVGGSISNTNVNSNTVTSGLSTSDPSFSQNLTQYGSLMSTSMKTLSYELSQQTATSTLTMSGTTGIFSATPNASGTAVFTITAAQLAGMTAIQFNTNGANTVIVNVTGDPITLSQNFLGGTNNLGQSVIWNFPDAKTLTLTTAWGGSVLAPNADATTYNYIQGSAVFGSLTQNGEMHIGTYSGTYSVPNDGSSSSTTSSSSGSTSVPEPGMAGLLGLGAAALLWRRRKMLAL